MKLATFLTCSTFCHASPTTLYKDTFENDLSQWIIEQAPPGNTFLKKGKLVILDASGCTVWFKHKLKGPIKIDFEATLVDQGGPYDRVSDLNCFWMATHPKQPNLFTQNSRTGTFTQYHPLRLYYVGYGANHNTTTRFRRYPGDGTRPCLPQHDLSDPQFLHTPNTTLKITILSEGARQRYLCNGKTVFDYTDPSPLTEGWFGFRTVNNHLVIDNFHVTLLPPANNK
ncbi:DUF6250 domain-containing protein [Rubritalea tangerina]|uniref:DUF6250 domain-containing protein n=1 Tax=Rubritalea tangerina TaxID=430798 RepID=A0ABW4Z8W7_9BACT